MEPITILFFCPHCNEELTEIDYKSTVYEYGTTVPYIDSAINGPKRIYTGDYEASDSTIQDTDYSCPHCSGDLNNLNQILIKKLKPKKQTIPNRDDSESHIHIVSPKKLQSATPNENAIICVNKKCKSLILVSIKENSEWTPPAWINNRLEWLETRRQQKDSWKIAPVGCPKCGTLNSPQDFFNSLLDSSKKQQTS